MDEKIQGLVETLKSDPGAAEALFRSEDGRRLLAMLTQGDRGAALQRAAGQASQGDMAALIRLVGQVMRSPEGAALAERISKNVKS